MTTAQTSEIPATHPLGFLPNVLTIGRIIMIPFIVAGIVLLADGPRSFLGSPTILLSLFLLAGLTDFLDGFLARRWNVVSDFGRMIDPIADKLLVAGCLIGFCVITRGDPFIMIPALAIIGRDILVSGAREHAALSGRVMPPTNLAKWKTAFEMAGIAVLIVWAASRSVIPLDIFMPPFVQWSGLIGLVLIWLAAILSVYTGSLYVRAAIAKAPA